MVDYAALSMLAYNGCDEVIVQDYSILYYGGLSMRCEQ